MPTALPVLLAISFCHLLNDMMQALLPAMYPMLKAGFHLDFGQIGLITFTFQLTASLLQPVIGLYTDHHPKPYSLMVGMSFTFIGLLFLSATRSYPGLLVSAGLVGLGSAVFHPESSRVARMASGGRHGFAQSLFQVGGNTGSAVGPLLAAFVVLPRGQGSVAWFSVAALVAILVLWRVGGWYRRHPARTGAARAAAPAHHALPPGKVRLALAVLVVLIFSKYIYLVSI